MVKIGGIFAEMELENIREQSIENRIARAKRGFPTAGPLPFGRKFDKKTEQWELDEEIAQLLQWAANEYLKGESLRNISETLRIRHNQPLSYNYLLTVLTERCGDKWTVQFKDQEPFIYTIPRILDDETIQRIKNKVAHNRIDNRTDVKKYVLTGFIRCENCGKSLSGQTQINKYGTQFKYYNHPGRKSDGCRVFNSVPLKQIENAVFQTIFENIADIPAFEKAIKGSLPDEKLINSLKQNIKTREKELRNINRELDKLVNAVLNETLDKMTIRKREQEFLKSKEQITGELEDFRIQLQQLPDINQVKEEAEDIRLQLMRRYSSKERLAEMTFDEKRTLLHWLFNGMDSKGAPYGIYVMKKGSGKNEKVDYFLYGRITGLRTLKGGDIDYYDDSNDDNQNSLAKKGAYHGNKVYKTNTGTHQRMD